MRPCMLTCLTFDWVDARERLNASWPMAAWCSSMSLTRLSAQATASIPARHVIPSPSLMVKRSPRRRDWKAMISAVGFLPSVSAMYLKQ